MGVVYALEQIAQDSPRELHWPITEVLTASLQERSQRDRREPEGRCGSTDVQAIDLAVLLGPSRFCR